MKSLALTGVLACALLGAAPAGAAEWFVDKSRPNDDGDGTRVETAKRTIQAAVKAASAGDTITVLPGVYDEGLSETTYDGLPIRCRVFIDKRLTLQSRDGAAVTHIVGQHDSSTENNTARYGTGDAAVRCIGFTNYTAAANSVVSGFTIRDGASYYGDGSDKFAAYGGGVMCPGWGGGSSISVVDCVVSNCVATRGGGVANVTLVRSLVTCCRADKSGAAGRYLWAYNCVFAKNRNFNDSVDQARVVTYSKIVNCDIVENNMYTIDGSVSMSVYNSIFFGNQGDANNTDLAAHCHNCLSDIASLTTNNCFSGDYKASVFAPAAHDFRVVSGGAADGSGSVALLDQIPSAYRDTDYLGNPRKTGDTVNVGAVEGRAVSRGRFAFAMNDGTNERISVNGLPELVRPSHVNVEAIPTAIRIRIRAKDGDSREIVRLRCSDNSHSFYPEWDGSFVVTPFSSGEYTIAEVVRGTTVYADADATAAVEDGSAANPYHTLQAAVDAIGNDNGVVLLARGHYDKGGKLAAGTVSNRCEFAGSGWCVVRAVEGPGVTFVHGASSESSTTGDGRGPGAVRCFGMSGTGRAFVVGVTACDGRTDSAEGRDIQSGGAAYLSSWDANSNLYFIDCVVSNNIATCGGIGRRNAGQLLFIRCRMTGNSSPGNALLVGATAANSLFYGNGAEGDMCTVIGGDSSAYNCTVFGNAYVRGFAADAVKVANCVFTGASPDKSGSAGGDKVFNTVYTTTSVEEDLSANDVAQADPMLASPVSGDFRLTSVSPASVKSLAAVSQAFWQMNFPVDAFGNPYTVDASGRFEPGAVAGIASAVLVSSRFLDSSKPYDDKVSPCGVVVVDGLETLTLTPTGTSPFKGYTVDGMFVPASGAYSFQLDPENLPSCITADYAQAGLAILVR